MLDTAYNFRFKTGLGSRVHTGRIIYSILYRVENAYKRRHCVYIHEVVYIHRKAIRCFLSSLFSAKNKNKQKQAPESFRGKAVSECASLGSQAQPLAASFQTTGGAVGRGLHGADTAACSTEPSCSGL